MKGGLIVFTQCAYYIQKVHEWSLILDQISCISCTRLNTLLISNPILILLLWWIKT